MNVDASLVVTGTVNFNDRNYTNTRVQGLSDYCIWTLDDEGIDLGIVARSQSQFFLTNLFTLSNLVIPGNTLPSGFDMSFYLTCNVGSSITNTYKTSTATISVRTMSSAGRYIYYN